jgi:hypothetical protein
MNFRRGQRYSAQKVVHNGIVFASKGEAALYDHLWLMEKAGRIRIEKLQDNIRLSEAKILYIADFKIYDLEIGEYIWIEFKGFESARWPMIKKLWKKFGPGKLKIYKGSYRRNGIRLFLTEVIEPETVKQLELING